MDGCVTAGLISGWEWREGRRREGWIKGWAVDWLKDQIEGWVDG